MRDGKRLGATFLARGSHLQAFFPDEHGTPFVVAFDLSSARNKVESRYLQLIAGRILIDLHRYTVTKHPWALPDFPLSLTVMLADSARGDLASTIVNSDRHGGATGVIAFRRNPATMSNDPGTHHFDYIANAVRHEWAHLVEEVSLHGSHPEAWAATAETRQRLRLTTLEAADGLLLALKDDLRRLAAQDTRIEDLPVRLGGWTADSVETLHSVLVGSLSPEHAHRGVSGPFVRLARTASGSDERSVLGRNQREAAKRNTLALLRNYLMEAELTASMGRRPNFLSEFWAQTAALSAELPDVFVTLDGAVRDLSRRMGQGVVQVNTQSGRSAQYPSLYGVDDVHPSTWYPLGAVESGSRIETPSLPWTPGVLSLRRQTSALAEPGLCGEP